MCSELRNYCKNSAHKRQNYGATKAQSTKTRRISKTKTKTQTKSTAQKLDIYQKSARDPQQQFGELNKRIERLEKKSKPTITFKQYNQYNQQVIVLAPNDNYVKKLTMMLGSTEQALQYLENCASNQIYGDINLFSRLYLQDRTIPPFFPTTNGVRLIDSDGNLINDVAGKQTIKNYCNNSQSAYLEMITSRIIKDLQSRKPSPMRRLSSPATESTLLNNQTMLDCTGKCASLSDPAYQKRLLREMVETVEDAIKTGQISSEKEALTVQMDSRRRNFKRILRIGDALQKVE